MAQYDCSITPLSHPILSLNFALLYSPLFISTNYSNINRPPSINTQHNDIFQTTLATIPICARISLPTAVSSIIIFFKLWRDWVYFLPSCGRALIYIVKRCFKNFHPPPPFQRPTGISILHNSAPLSQLSSAAPHTTRLASHPTTAFWRSHCAGEHPHTTHQEHTFTTLWELAIYWAFSR